MQVPPKTVTNAPSPKPGAAAAKSASTKGQPAPQLKPKPKPKSGGFFGEDRVTIDTVVNEQVEFAHHQRMLSRVFLQGVIMTILVGLLVFLAPFLQPIYHYYARDPDGNVILLDPMTMPNLTDRAILSWSVTSVTEVMTLGFGDLLTQLNTQKPRFTEDGWASFGKAFYRQRINEVFKANQLVLTTVPSDTAVIIWQGLNERGDYEWRVQVPVIMTYATNNNVTQHHHSLITLSIVRANPELYPTGIAIKSWLVMG